MRSDEIEIDRCSLSEIDAYVDINKYANISHVCSL